MSADAPIRPCHVCGEARALRRLFRKSGFTIVRCETCGLIFTNEIPSAAALTELYGAGFFAVGQKFSDDVESVGTINARQRLERILELPGVGRDRWLDVGCATGDFLAAARPVVREADGVELSSFACERARARGLPVACGDFRSVELPNVTYDVICMWDYIEHVPEPGASLERALALLRPNGYLVLSTGDASSLAARALGRFWHLVIPPKHLYFFTPGSLVRLLQRVGFLMVKLDWPGKRVPLDFAAWKLAAIAAPPLAPRALRAATSLGLGRLCPSINLRDIMTVYARKP